MRKNSEQDGATMPEADPLDEPSLRFLNAVQNRDDIDLLQHMDGVNLNVKNPDGQTALHLAIHNADISMVHFLLEKGADPEVTASNGNKPLYDAAESGYFEIVELLLDFNADVEAFNINEQRTAFYQAVENGHVAVAKSLLRAGADIDARSPSGLTPLFCAVRRGDVQLVQYLLEHGANKKLQLDDGQTVDDFAKDNPAIVYLLQSSQVLRGPSIKTPKSTNFERRFIPMPSLPAEVDKQDACHGFEATIIDFFLGDREERIQVSASIYDVLYGKGAEAIMESERVAMMGEQQAQFRWYHLPANNIEWVEALISRIFAERNTGSATLDDELKSKLGLTSTAGRQYRISTAQSSFMRPLFQNFDTTPRADQLVLFMPYLHFETLRGYQEMAHQIMTTRYPPEAPREPLPAHHLARGKRSSRAKRATESPLVRIRTKKVPETDDALSTTSNTTAEKTGSTWKNILHRAGILRSTLQDLKGRVGSKPARLSRTEGTSAAEGGADNGDLEKGTKKKSTLLHTWLEENAGNSKSTTIDLTTGKTRPEAQVAEKKIEFADERHIEKSTEERFANTNDSMLAAENFPDGPQNTTGEEISPPDNEEQDKFSSVPEAANQEVPGAPEYLKPLDRPTPPEISRKPQNASQTFHPPSRADTFKGKEKLADIPEGSQLRTESPRRESKMASRQFPRPERRGRVALGQLDELLIKAYSFSNTPGQLPPLQLRRTLDQYFYTHLSSTYERDTDQVVLRYTWNSQIMEPKIFMVDQLWLWVLNGDTVISCFPQRWDSWSTDIRMQPPPPPPMFSMPAGQAPRPPPLNPGGPVKPKKRVPPPPPNWPSRPLPPRQTVPPEPAKLSQLPSDAIHSPPQFTLAEETHDETNVLINLDEVKSKERSKNDPSSLLSWMAGKKKKGRKEFIDTGFPTMEAKNSRPTSSLEQEEKRRRQAFLQLDPLNVHQTILKHLQGTRRAPITTVYGLANLITNSCSDVFDQFKTPPEFQFFDFFERSIGALIDQETYCFKLFMRSLEKTAIPPPPAGPMPPNTDPFLSIAAETKLLVEIKDIRDELGILEMILKDQLKVLKEFAESIVSKDENVPVTQSKVLLNHLERIQKMNEQADKTYQALNDLLDLKQKEFNVSEARRQAEITARHVEIAGQSQEQGQRQLTLAEATARQAEETARQGKTVMLFTVVTIIFLPLSFMSAFFAIAIDVFPVNDNGKLPLRYVLKYMLTISAAISIPFILVAFNQDRIARWLKTIGTGGAIWWTIITVMIGILLSVIWTSHLVAGIKVAVTVTFVLLALVAGIGQFIYAVVETTRLGLLDSSGSGSLRSLSDD